MSPRFVLGRENVPCVADVVNRSLKADCTEFTCIILAPRLGMFRSVSYANLLDLKLLTRVGISVKCLFKE